MCYFNNFSLLIYTYCFQRRAIAVSRPVFYFYKTKIFSFSCDNVNLPHPTAEIAFHDLISLLLQISSCFLFIDSPQLSFVHKSPLTHLIQFCFHAIHVIHKYKYFRNNMKIAVIPLTVMSLLFIFVPSLTSSTSFMILPSGAIAIGIAYLMYKKRYKVESK